MADLTIIEKRQFSAYDATVERTRNSVVECGRALLAIDEGRLWRCEFDSFKAYLAARFPDMPLSTAYYRMAAAKKSLPTTRRAVANEADDDTPPEPGKPEPAVQTAQPARTQAAPAPAPEPAPPVVDSLGQAIEDQELAQVFTDGIEQYETLLTTLRSAATILRNLMASRAGAHLQQNTKMWLSDAIKFVNAAIPYCLCPDDVANGRYHDAGFITESQWKEVQKARGRQH